MLDYWGRFLCYGTFAPPRWVAVFIIQVLCMSEKDGFLQRIIIIGILVCFLLAFLLPYFTHGALTLLHGDEFKESYTYRMTGNAYLFRVLSYTGDLARVYYVGTSSGFIFEFSRNDGIWETVSSNRIWCHVGNVYPSFIWPYFYHSDAGLLFFIALIIFTLAVLLLVPFVIRNVKRAKRTY